MECNVQFISDLSDFIERILAILENEIDCQIFISGTFDNMVYKNILDKILKGSGLKNCKMIIPYVTSSGIISRAYINKICGQGGQVRLNSKFKNNIIVVGSNVFVLSFSSKYTKEVGLKSNFECCVQTNHSETVKNVCETFMAMWDKGLPLANA
jgi:hypothetical protein